MGWWLVGGENRHFTDSPPFTAPSNIVWENPGIPGMHRPPRRGPKGSPSVNRSLPSLPLLFEGKQEVGPRRQNPAESRGSTLPPTQAWRAHFVKLLRRRLTSQEKSWIGCLQSGQTIKMQTSRPFLDGDVAETSFFRRQKEECDRCYARR